MRMPDDTGTSAYVIRVMTVVSKALETHRR